MKKQYTIKISLFFMYIFFVLSNYVYCAYKFDNSLFTRFLDEYTHNGKVSYKEIKKDTSLLDAYLNKISNIKQQEIDLMTDDEKAAFYINAYNAFAIKITTENYPIKSIKDIRDWNSQKNNIAGRQFSLEEIKNDILCRQLKKPEAYFALSNTSLGSAVLRSEPYCGIKLAVQLDGQIRLFAEDIKKAKYDQEHKILYLSEGLEWYLTNKDGNFANSRLSVIISFIKKYLTFFTDELIVKKDFRVEYLQYDWALNELEGCIPCMGY